MKNIVINQSDVLEIIKTKRDATIVSSQIEQMLTQSFTVAKASESLLEEYFPYDRKTKILNLLSKYSIDIRNPVDVEAFFIVLKQVIADMPVVGLDIAVSPRQDFVSSISSWFVVYVKKAVLLDITADESLIGGAVLMFNGIHKDYSVKKQLEEKYKKGELHISNT